MMPNKRGQTPFAQKGSDPFCLDPPRHVAIIMDGNGRWAQARGLPRVKGHETGVRRIEDLIKYATKIGIQYLTFYTFSKENWQRPKDEINFLMDLLARHLDPKSRNMIQRDAVFKVIGHIEDLPELIQQRIAYWLEKSKNNTGPVTTFALSYSSRLEIADACRKIAEEAVAGKINPREIAEETVSRHLYTAGIPDPDLLIRTSGEMRISNFLLWQISYSELYITDKYWPDFTPAEFAKAITAYQKRERRFGRTSVPAREA